MGKWTDLATRYPALPDDPTRLEAMRAHLDALRLLPVAEVAARHDAADARRKAAEDEASGAELERDAARIVLADQVKALGLERITVGGYNYTPSQEPWPVVTDKAALLAYGIDGHPEVLAYAHGTVKTLLKSALEGEGEVPPGVDVFFKRTLSRTKASTK